MTDIDPGREIFTAVRGGHHSMSRQCWSCEMGDHGPQCATASGCPMEVLDTIRVGRHPYDPIGEPWRVVPVDTCGCIAGSETGAGQWRVRHLDDYFGPYRWAVFPPGQQAQDSYVVTVAETWRTAYELAYLRANNMHGWRSLDFAVVWIYGADREDITA